MKVKKVFTDTGRSYSADPFKEGEYEALSEARLKELSKLPKHKLEEVDKREMENAFYTMALATKSVATFREYRATLGYGEDIEGLDYEWVFIPAPSQERQRNPLLMFERNQPAHYERRNIYHEDQKLAFEQWRQKKGRVG